MAVYGLYLLAAVMITWPLVTVFSTRLLGHPFGDSYEYTRHIWWITHALRSGQPLFAQPLLVYPTGLDGAWLWGNPLQSFPAWLFAFVLPLPAAFNLMALLTLALNGWTLYWLVWRLVKSRPAAVLAGLVFLAYPHFQGQLGAGHTGLLVLWPVPLYVWGLFQLRETVTTSGRPNMSPLQRAVLFTALMFVVSLWGNQLLIVYLVGPVTALFAIWARRDWRWLARIISAAVIGGLVALIFFLPVIQDTIHAPPWLVEESGDVAFSADLLGLVTPSFQNPLYGHLDYTHRILGADPFERVAYLGILPLLLAGLAVIKRREVRPWLLLAAVAWVFSLGPLLKVLNQVVVLHLGDYDSAITLPWLVLQKLPLLNITRTPARFHFTIGLALAIMVGYGAAWLWERIRLRLSIQWLATSIAALFILFDYQFFWPFPTIPGEIPQAITTLQADDSVRAVLDLPWAHLLTDKDGLYLQTGYQKPMLGGHVTRRTPANPAQMTVLQDTLDPALLDAAGADVVIVHQQWDETGAVLANTRAKLGDPFYEDAHIAAFRVQAPESAADPTIITSALDLPLQIDNRYPLYFYAAQPGWLDLNIAMEGEGRRLHLLLDDEDVYWGSTAIQTLPLPVTTEGYHTLTLALEPSCPQPLSPALTCPTMTTHTLALDNFTASEPIEPVTLTHGITLAAAQISVEDDRLTADLWWQFGAPLRTDDVRFVHVLNAEGELVAQEDRALEFNGAGAIDSVQLDIYSLPPGEYRVSTGWYPYPDTTPFTQVDGSEGRIALGTFSVD
ncbi:MAG: hypothetical protein K8L99_13335 [Anaerolineae bacterium]|nr:hypothetical protein [Anaerolineae bacterium]